MQAQPLRLRESGLYALPDPDSLRTLDPAIQRPDRPLSFPSLSLAAYLVRVSGWRA